MIPRANSRYLLVWALADAASVCGVTLAVLANDPLLLVPFVAATVIALLMFRPRTEEFEQRALSMAF